MGERLVLGEDVGSGTLSQAGPNLNTYVVGKYRQLIRSEVGDRYRWFELPGFVDATLHIVEK